MISTTRIRTTNSAVDKIEEVASMLKKFKADNTDDVVNPQHFGIGSWYVRPAFQEFDMDLRDFVDSQSSHARAEDISAAVVNKLRDMAYDLFLESEYGVALDHMYVGNPPPEGSSPIRTMFLVQPRRHSYYRYQHEHAP